ncbi:DEAD/DEAH box helicase [Planomonospora sp. ID82291]|uniref:DEAD/DEAH box helicase n=1 Tax=Planomonospora sp. ID82291 TaxID=2738136 RepID=UPI0018C39288|nr:DEAD/DEAH box helicase [Planomonospora sp. ID82291]MBG0814017.1 DEAD/DEAH box helicase [Planomonospora sp. ID82291]
MFGLWPHQAEAAGLARHGRNVIIATGTASGKSLAYQVPALNSVLDGGTALYLTPTKALAADQLRALEALDVPGLRAAAYDGDTPYEERAWIRRHANYVLTNPDMLHRGLLPGHARWSGFWRRLRTVVVDECHGYRGVFGSHVAQILRRLRRVCTRYGSSPVFVLASATAGDPGAFAMRLTGLETAEVTTDTSPRGSITFALWEPPLTDLRGEGGAPVRRPAAAETADLLADLVLGGTRTLAFVRSRRAAESVALSARARLSDLASDAASRRPPASGTVPAASVPGTDPADPVDPPGPTSGTDPDAGGPTSGTDPDPVDPPGPTPPALTDLSGKVAAYRAGYLAEERRGLERALRSGDLLGLATTNALELGVDVSGLDAVLIAGWPGTRASLWQQAGRAGRAGQDALAVLVARDDPLDTYLVHHPQALFGRPVEAIVLDPGNPYVLGPHLCAAAAEIPLTEEDLEIFGPTSKEVLASLVDDGLLRHRPTGWFWTRRERATDLADIRGSGGSPVQVVELSTGCLLGTVDESSAHTIVHTGAVYLHQGETFLVTELDLEAGVALVEAGTPDYTTFARDVTEISVLESFRSQALGPGELHFGAVEVTRQVVSYLKRRLQSGEILGDEALDLPPRTLHTRAVWWTLPASAVSPLAEAGLDLGGAAHAAEHASIGMLPLFATCDRWDIGGVSTELHADTGLLTVFVYDGHEGGAGFAERGFARAFEWLTATREAIASCECERGCPSCIQSPKCGNGNDPLDKAGALRLLAVLLSMDG